MLTIAEQITIKADVNKIWAFLTDFSLSLNFNRFHTKLELPTQYSVGKMKKFKIDHNFGFGNYDMVAEITECIPPTKISLKEYCGDDPEKGFPHTATFEIKSGLDSCILIYTVVGTYGAKMQDLPFTPILKGVVLEELIKIKSAVESSESSSEPLITETINPI